MIAALALSLILASSQPDARGWNPGDPPEPGPTTGQFVWLGQEQDAKTPVNLYLRKPDGPPVDGKITVWSLVIYGTDHRIYSLVRQTIDCEANQSTRPQIQIYADGKAEGWTNGEERMYPIPPQMAFLNKTRDLACAPPPDAVIVTDLAGAQADADGRSAGAK